MTDQTLAAKKLRSLRCAGGEVRIVATTAGHLLSAYALASALGKLLLSHLHRAT